MNQEDVLSVREAGRRASALQYLIDESLRRGLQESARVAQRELKQLRTEIYQKFDIRL